MDAQDLAAVWLTVKLAGVVTGLLLVVATPLAWWLARTESWLKPVIGAVVAMPLVLPPTVIGFYLLLVLGPHGPIGRLTEALGLGGLPFTFAGLVVGSLIYSLPFVVQPVQNAFEAIGRRPLEVAATLGAGPWDAFWSVALPMARPGLLTGAILGFVLSAGRRDVHVSIVCPTKSDARHFLGRELDALHFPPIRRIPGQAPTIPARRPDIAFGIHRHAVRHTRFRRRIDKDALIGQRAGHLVVVKDKDALGV